MVSILWRVSAILIVGVDVQTHLREIHIRGQPVMEEGSKEKFNLIRCVKFPQPDLVPLWFASFFLFLLTR